MNEAAVLCWSAAAIGTVHTLLGPDHYVPFVAMSRAGAWSQRKTVVVTALCGVGHVLGSVALGLIGIVAGTALFRMERIESVREEIAAWMLMGFGLLYFAWATVRAFRNRPHTHWHVHGGRVHCHEHRHDIEHLHVHAAMDGKAERASLTPWVLFTIFLFGPCEPLIPLLMYPAAAGSFWMLVLITLVFACATIATMTAIVWAATCSRVSWRPRILNRLGGPIAGLLILGCGAAMKAGY